jgi:uncharacterized protein
MRIVIDTNVVISRYIKPEGKVAQIFQAWEQETFELLVSQEILEEYQRALLYPDVQRRHQLTEEQVREVIDDLRELASIIQPTEKIAVVKDDADDNKFIECAVAGKAEYIVSGDPDLLAVKEYRGIQILSPTVFLAVWEEVPSI